jgi:hypothetical protein
LWRFLFPIGAILTIGGVFLYALVEHLSFGGTQSWVFAVLAQTFFPALLVGTPLAIIGSFVERSRLSVAQSRSRGMICLAVSAISFLLFFVRGNVHDWTFTFIFPAVVGFIAGVVLLSRLEDANP